MVQLRDFVKAEALDDATVTVVFAPNRARDVPLYVASLPIFSKAYYATQPFENRPPISRSARARTRWADTRSTAMSSSTGSRIIGPPICPSTAAATISIPCATSSIATAMSRSKALPARTISTARSSPRGSGLRATIFRRSRTAASRARPCRMNCRRAGRAGSSTPAATSSKTRRCAKRSSTPFDFEWTNKTVMYGAYARTVSPFQNSDMVATGLPSPEELKLLEPFRGQVPDEVFGEPFVPPVSDGSGQDRQLLRKAQRLLQDANLPGQGWQAAVAEWRGLYDRVPARRAVVPAASRQPLHQESRPARHRGQYPVDRRCAVPRAGGSLRFRYRRRCGSACRRRRATALRPYFYVAGGRHQGIIQSGGGRQSCDRRAGRQGHRRRNAR